MAKISSRSPKKRSTSATLSWSLTAACSSVLARLDGAVVDPVLAPLPGESGLADAVEVVDGIHTLSIVGARRVHAVVNIDLAKLSSPSG